MADDKRQHVADTTRTDAKRDYPKEPPEVTHPSELLSATRQPGFWDSEYAPLAIAAAEVMFGSVLDFFVESPAEALLKEQMDYNDIQKLRASGVFSEEDIAAIEAGNKPVVDKIAQGLASRGLGSSAAGADIIAQAQAAPFHKLQAQAAGLYQTGLIHAANLVKSVAAENAAFSKSVGNLAKLYQTMKADGLEPGSEPLFSEFDELTRQFAALLEEE